MNRFVGNGHDQTRDFQDWLNRLSMLREFGEVFGDVQVQRTIRMTGQRWTVIWRHGELIANHQAPILHLEDATRFKLGDWTLQPIKRASDGLLVTATDDRQRGYSTIEGLRVFNCDRALSVFKDSLEQTAIRGFTTVGCPQAVRIESPSMDLFSIADFSFRRYKVPCQEPVIDVVRSGSVRFYNGHVSHIHTSAASIRLHGGTHVLRDIWIENPNTLALEVKQARGRNNTIVDALVLSPDSKTADGISVCLKRNVNLLHCSFSGDVVYDADKRRPEVIGCRFNDNAKLRKQPT